MTKFCKRCPSCNKLYKIVIEECPDCKIRLKVVFTDKEENIT